MTTFGERRLFLLSAALALTLSLVGKFLADAWLDERVAIIGTSVGLVYALNPGIAFGLTFTPIVQTFLIGAALLLVLWAALKERGTPLAQTGFGLIIGGAVGNLLDRLFDGMVTDMFQVGTFPVFNVADSCITIGAALLIVSGLRRTVR